MDYRTLLLDVAYKPIKVITWKRALNLDFDNKVTVVETYDAVARSASQEFVLPAVVALKQFHGFRPFKVRFSKRNVFLRDGLVCQYCGQKFTSSCLTWDHVVPRAQGGKSTWENCTTACEPCNHTKGNRTPEEAGMKLLTQPVRPTPGLHGHIVAHMAPPEWEQYLGMAALA